MSRSSEFLRRAVYLYIGVNSVLIMLSMTWVNGLLQVFVQLGLLAGFTWGVLFIFGDIQRFSQTFIALLGVDSIISFCSLPVVGLLKSEMLPEKGFVLFLSKIKKFTGWKPKISVNKGLSMYFDWIIKK